MMPPENMADMAAELNCYAADLERAAAITAAVSPRAQALLLAAAETTRQAARAYSTSEKSARRREGDRT